VGGNMTKVDPLRFVSKTFAGTIEKENFL
jgi:hypothetical protein